MSHLLPFAGISRPHWRFSAVLLPVWNGIGAGSPVSSSDDGSWRSAVLSHERYDRRPVGPRRL